MSKNEYKTKRPGATFAVVDGSNIDSLDEIEYYDWGEGPKFGRSSNGGGSGPNFEKYIKYPVDMTDITAQERSESPHAKLFCILGEIDVAFRPIVGYFVIY